MSANSNIEWTDATWNPTRGCSRVSPGCVNCYAERQAIRHAGAGGHYEGLVKSVNGHPRWTGKMRTVSEKLDEPLRWTKPRRVFVDSMSDLFHENLRTEDIRRVLAYAVAAVILRGHTMQALTKRAERMHDLLTEPGFWDPIATEAASLVEMYGGAIDAKRRWEILKVVSSGVIPGLWLGVSVEDQERADERIPLLLQTPAAVRFLSCEPLLGPIDLRRHVGASDTADDDLEPTDAHCVRCGSLWEEDGTKHECPPGFGPRPSWVIVGGESGPGARPCDVAWVRSIVEQCQAAGVPAFVKQLGACVMFDPGHPRNPSLAPPTRIGHLPAGWEGRGRWRLALDSRKGGVMAEWPRDLRVREFPNA